MRRIEETILVKRIHKMRKESPDIAARRPLRLHCRHRVALTPPFIGHQQYALRKIQRAESRVDRHAHDRIGKNHILRSEEHTSELQSRGHLVCRLLLEKKK